MKHLKKYESFSEEDLYNKWKEFIQSLIETFLDFEDNGWYWSTHPDICVMLKDEESYIPPEKNYNIDYTGYFRNGEIIWDTKEFNYKEKNKEVIDISEESKDFIVSIKRLHDITGVNFSFSYNNKGGELKIVIRGFVKIKLN